MHFLQLPRALDVLLVEPPRLLGVGLGGERRYHLGHVPVLRDVGDEVADQRECLHRLDGDLSVELVDRGLAHQPRYVVYLSRAGPAVPALQFHRAESDESKWLWM